MPPKSQKKRTDVGLRVEQARTRAGYESQAELADAIQVRPQTIWRIETGGYPLSRATARKLARALNVSESWLMFGEREEAPKTPPSVEVYLASELGSDTPEQVQKRLRMIDYAALGIPSPAVKDVHRVRELVEFNLSLGRKRLP